MGSGCYPKRYAAKRSSERQAESWSALSENQRVETEVVWARGEKRRGLCQEESVENGDTRQKEKGTAKTKVDG